MPLINKYYMGLLEMLSSTRLRIINHVFTCILVVVMGVLPGCNDDDERFLEPTIDDRFIVLQHDGPNVDAPILPAETYEAAVRFTDAKLSVAIGGRLTEIHYFVEVPPDYGEVRGYTSKSGDTPDQLIYQREITLQTRAGEWNKHTLLNPISLNADDLWIAIRFRQANNQPTIGCDPGPAQPNGDWLWDASDSQWLPLSQRSNININWNIRAAVAR